MPSPAVFADAQCKSQVLAHDVRETSDLLPTGASHHSSVTEEHDKPVSIAEWLVPPPVDVDADAHGSPQRAGDCSGDWPEQNLGDRRPVTGVRAGRGNPAGGSRQHPPEQTTVPESRLESGRG